MKTRLDRRRKMRMTAKKFQKIIEEHHYYMHPDKRVIVQGNVTLWFTEEDRDIGLDVYNVTIKGDLNLFNSGDGTLKSLYLEGVKVHGNLYLGHFARKGQLHINEKVKLWNVRVKRMLVMENLEIGAEILFSHVAVGDEIVCGDNLPLAMKCFFHFGSRVDVNYHTIAKTI